MNTTETKMIVREGVIEARTAGLSIRRISEVTGISMRTMQRWNAGLNEDRRKGTRRRVHHKLSEDERRESR